MATVALAEAQRFIRADQAQRTRRTRNPALKLLMAVVAEIEEQAKIDRAEIDRKPPARAKGAPQIVPVRCVRYHDHQQYIGVRLR